MKAVLLLPTKNDGKSRHCFRTLSLRYAQLLNITINSTVISTLFRHSRLRENDDGVWGNNVVRVNLKKVEHGVKSRGFDMKSTHMTDLDKLHNLMAILTIAVCSAYRTGSWRIDQGGTDQS